MRRTNVIVLVLACYLSSVSDAFAEWQEIGRNATKTVYVDVNTIKITGNKSRIWRLINHNKVIVVPDGTEYRSAKTLQEFDCLNLSSRLVYVVAFKELMGQGKVIAAGYQPVIWDANVPDSISEEISRYACSNKLK